MTAKRKNNILFSIAASVILVSCNDGAKQEAESSTETDTTAQNVTLPYLGIPDVEFRKNEDGSMMPDTIPYTIPKFSFINQDSKEISHRNYDGHIFLVDYFFTSCPSICPVMSAQLARLQDMLKEKSLWGDVMILSHTVDPDRDNPEKLKEFGERIGADFAHWNFVTGDKEDLYSQAKQGYFLTALPSDTAAGGFFHSDQVLLIDRGFHIRGSYDGTSTKAIDQLFNDILKLENEQPAGTH